MEMLASISLKKQWRRRKYRRMNSNPSSRRKNVPIIRLGGKTRRVWRIRSVPKFQFKLLCSPSTLWKKFKNAYTNMMLNLAGNVGSLSDGNAFSASAVKRIPAAVVRVEPLPYDKNEFENRLVYEIYKSLVVSLELNSK